MNRKSTFQQIFLNVATKTAFLGFPGGTRIIHLNNPVSASSLERISNLSYKWETETHFLASSGTLVVGRKPKA